MSEPDSLQAERLMAHMKVLCSEIGPRPPASPQERRAAEYVKKTLASLGVTDIQEQPFKSWPSVGGVNIPYFLSGALAMFLGDRFGRLGKLLGGLLALGVCYDMQQFSLTKPPIFRRLISQVDSQNIIATIPPKGEVKRRLFLVGHLDTNKQRFAAPPPFPGLMKPSFNLAFGVTIASALKMLADALTGHQRLSGWQRLTGLMALLFAGVYAYDETQPYVEGANDNATAVSVLLGIVEALRQHRLEHTAVTCLFTGCEEVVCAGMESYLEQYAPPKYNTYWIDLEMVGTGNICYVTKHGLHALGEYHPAPEMLTIAARAAIKHPELTVAGKDMLILEEVGNLVRHGYKAVCVAGYNQEGYLPNWHRVSDKLENIEPGTLSRAARYTWAIMQEIEQLPG